MNVQFMLFKIDIEDLAIKLVSIILDKNNT